MNVKKYQVFITLLFVMGVVSHFYLGDIMNLFRVFSVDSYLLVKGLIWAVCASGFFMCIFICNKKLELRIYSVLYVINLVVFAVFFVELNRVGLRGTGFIGTLSMLFSFIGLVVAFRISLIDQISKLTKITILISSIGILLNKSYIYIFVVHYIASFLTTSRDGYYETYNIYDNIFIIFHALTTVLYLLSLKQIKSGFESTNKTRKTLQF